MIWLGNRKENINERNRVSLFNSNVVYNAAYTSWCRPRWLSWMRRPTGDRRSRVQPPPRSATFFRRDWLWNIFYGHSLPSLIQEGQLSVSGERMCTILVNRLEDYACPINVWLHVGKLTALDMTPLGWLGRKTSTQTNIHLNLSRTRLFKIRLNYPKENRQIKCHAEVREETGKRTNIWNT